MRLESLTIHGFKSFAKSSELVFSEPVTAIVGPNGSGKSNVAEALRFVLGEQSVKSLRGKKGEDLIWGGSESVSKMNRAAVKVQFDNTTKSLSIDTDTVTVERVVYRDGQNEYKINGQTVRLKDVHELLAQGNIGPSGHHIISQGEADRILSATVVERKNILEDALGLKVFQYKKKEAEKKLEKTSINIHEVSALRRELAPRLAFLERELKKHEEADRLKNQLHDDYLSYLKREDIYLAYHQEKNEKSNHLLKQQEQELQEEIAAKEQRLAETKESDDDEEVRIRLQSEVEDVQKERRVVENSYNQLSGKLSFLLDQLKKERGKNVKVTISYTDIAPHFDTLFETVDTVISSKGTESSLANLKEVVTSFKKQLSLFTKDKDTTNLAELERQVSTIEKELKDLEENIERIKNKEITAREKFDAHIQSRVEASRGREQDTKELYEIRTRLTECQAEIRELQYESNRLYRERDAFKDELREAVALLDRRAAHYVDYELNNPDGIIVLTESIYSEQRDIQYKRKQDLERLKIRIETLGVGDAEDVKQEYQEVKERDIFLAKEIEDLETSVAQIDTLIKELDDQIQNEFSAGFEKINTEFQNYFTLMFGGGTAYLELVSITDRSEDSEGGDEDVVRSGVEVVIKLPNKRVQSLAMLSGGERALTSIALLFAISQVHPPPFIVLDETDAALDEANSRRYGDLIEMLAKRSQLVLITHNRETMSRANVLYGVTMGEAGVSSLLSVKLDEAVVNAK